MAGSLFGRLSLEDGDSANSLEGLEIKLGGEGKNRSLPTGCVRGCSIVYKSDNKSAGKMQLSTCLFMPMCTLASWCLRFALHLLLMCWFKPPECDEDEQRQIRTQGSM